MTDVLREATVAHDRLRGAVADYHRARALTQAAILGRGSRRHSPEELAQRVGALRNTKLEEEAAHGLRDYLRLLSGAEPGLSDVDAGLPPSTAIAACSSPAAALGGAWQLSSIFEYLAGSEGKIQGELGIDVPGVALTLRRWAPPVVALGALGALGWIGWDRWRPNRPPMPGESGSPPAPEIPEEEEDDELATSS